MSAAGWSDVLFGWVAQCYNGVDLFGSRNVEFSFNFWIIVEGVDGKSYKAAAKAHGMCPKKNVLGGEKCIVMGTAGPWFAADHYNCSGPVK